MSDKNITINNETRPMTAEEEAVWLENITKTNEILEAKATEAQAKATAQASGNQKLLDLGLSQAEATALTGFVPIAVKYQNLIDAGKTPEEATALTGYTPPSEE